MSKMPEDAILLALDPGTYQTGFVYMDADMSVMSSGVGDNSKVLREVLLFGRIAENPVVAIEMIEGRGMAVGKEVFETCVWVGRFVQAVQCDSYLVYRRHVKLHLCGNNRAKDSNVSQALKDLYGGDTAVGTKKNPGPLYGVKSHAWAALGVGRYVIENWGSPALTCVPRV